MRVNISKAHDKTVVTNYRNNPAYTPYCLRCSGLHRMRLVEPLLWTHDCGAVHDERQCITVSTASNGAAE